MDIISSVFKRFAARPHGSFDVPLTSKPESGVLLVGDDVITRALLFLAAVTSASETGQKVLFFTQNPIQSFPVGIKGSSAPSSGQKHEGLKKIRFVYPRTVKELLEDIASLHELVKDSTMLPTLLIIDRLERYVCPQDQPNVDVQSTVAHVLALLHDTSTFLTQKTNAEGTGTPCKIMVSYHPEREPPERGDASLPDPVLSVLERYLLAKCVAKKEPTLEGGHQAWLLCISGPGLQVSGHVEEGLQWRAVLQPDGALEFSPKSTLKEEASLKDHTDRNLKRQEPKI